MKKCPECNSEKIIENARAVDQGEGGANMSFCVTVEEFPNAVIFKQRVFSAVKPKICADCGFIQFYAESPKMLWNTYQNQKKNIS